MVALLVAVRSASEGKDELEGLRSSLRPRALLDGGVLAQMGGARRDLDSARSWSSSPLTLPLRILPVAGRQVTSTRALAEAGVDALDAGIAALDEVDGLLEDTLPAGPARVELLERIGDVARDAKDTVDRLDLGPDRGLVGPLADARDSAAEGVEDVSEALGRAAAVAEGLHVLLDGRSENLLLAANNSEMRNGSGMFLQLGPLFAEQGNLRLGDLVEARKVRLPVGRVQAGSTTYGELWSYLQPTVEWRNLAASPRYPVTAELAARMWQAQGGHPPEAVLAVDPYALRALLRATGPVQVGDERIGAQGVVQLLLHDQYKGLDAVPELDEQSERRDRLGDIASAAFAALSEGDIDVVTLLEGLQDAARHRHILAWSPDPVLQAGWEAAGIDGELDERSLTVGVLNRGVNKLDYFLRVDAQLDVEPPVDGSRKGRLTVELRNRLPEGEAGYIAGPAPGVEGVDDYGDYKGILAVTLPGSARNAAIEGVDQLDVAAPDGPSLSLATDFLLDRGASARYVVTFDLPADLDRVTLVPTARAVPVTWGVGERDFVDDARHTVRLGS